MFKASLSTKVKIFYHKVAYQKDCYFVANVEYSNRAKTTSRIHQIRHAAHGPQ